MAKSGTLFAAATTLILSSLGVAAVVPACAPVTKRLVAPAVCPTGYVRSVVVLDISHPKPGTTTWSSDLYCIKSSGRPVMASEGFTFLTFWGLAAALVLVASVTGALFKKPSTSEKEPGK